MTRLLRYAEPYFWLILAAVMLLFGQAMCDLALPDYMSDIVNEGIATGDTGTIIGIGFRMILISLTGGMLSIAVGYLASRVGAGIGQQLRIDLFEKVESFSNVEFDRFSTSSLITRTTNDVTQVQTLVIMMIRMIFYAPIMGIGGIIHAVNNSASMSWIIALAIVVLVGIIATLFSLALPRFKVIQTLVDRLNQVVRENLSGLLVTRAFNTQDFEEARFDKENKTLTDTNLFVNRTMAAMMPLMMLLMNLITVLIVWVGSYQVSAFKIDVGQMMAYMQYVMQIIMAFLMMSMMFIMIPRASVSAVRIADVLESDPQIKNRPDALPFSSSEGVLRFDHVSFRYPGAEEDVLHDIDFTAKPGETTAFIGSTGSGKSTIANLVPRFYDVTEGSITIDGTDIRDMELHSLRSQLGYVPQKAVLFSGTIDSNLRYADKNATDEEILSGAQIAQAMEFIDSRPEGFETPIAQGGSNVSGGQKQRLSIARALVKKPQIYIFDDSFSALDFKTDSALRAALRKETGGSTVLLIAQRISTIMDAEQIIVLEAGKIAGKGTHEQLMKSCEVYREIALSQLSKEELNE
ncbi:MAG: ABC transporter ATP-binding protein [Proteocatella sp.]|nr:ABC transporter ATP-binding protein [Proteocatella sp.]MBP9967056.1 ABC transporter ATP-binding protein [Proteocatella sp.]